MQKKELVTGIIDGNTFETDSGNEPRRLAGVRIPDPDGWGGAQAFKALEVLIAGKTISVEPLTLDQDGALLVPVVQGGKSMTEAMDKELEDCRESLRACWITIREIEGSIRAHGLSVASRGVNYGDWYLGFIDGNRYPGLYEGLDVVGRNPEWPAIDRFHRLRESSGLGWTSADEDGLKLASDYFVRLKGMLGRIASIEDTVETLYWYSIQPHTRQAPFVGK